jgi:hypothetical protein
MITSDVARDVFRNHLGHTSTADALPLPRQKNPSDNAGSLIGQPSSFSVSHDLTPLTYLVDALGEAMMAPSVVFAVDIMALLTWIAVLQTLAIVVLKRTTRT